MDVGKIVDGDNADEHGWQLDQTSLFALLRSKQRFARTKISGAMRDLLDPLACTYGKVTHLNSRTALPILLRPAAIKRCGHTRAGPDKDNHVLRDRWDVAEARKARQKENKEQETADILGSKTIVTITRGAWYRNRYPYRHSSLHIRKRCPIRALSGFGAYEQTEARLA